MIFDMFVMDKNRENNDWALEIQIDVSSMGLKYLEVNINFYNDIEHWLLNDEIFYIDDCSFTTKINNKDKKLFYKRFQIKQGKKIDLPKPFFKMQTLASSDILLEFYSDNYVFMDDMFLYNETLFTLLNTHFLENLTVMIDNAIRNEDFLVFRNSIEKGGNKIIFTINRLLYLEYEKTDNITYKYSREKVFIYSYILLYKVVNGKDILLGMPLEGSWKWVFAGNDKVSYELKGEEVYYRMIILLIMYEVQQQLGLNNNIELWEITDGGVLFSTFSTLSETELTNTILQNNVVLERIENGKGFMDYNGLFDEIKRTCAKKILLDKDIKNNVLKLYVTNELVLKKFDFVGK